MKDVAIAEDMFGPDEGSIKGTTPKHKPNVIQDPTIIFPEE